MLGLHKSIRTRGIEFEMKFSEIHGRRMEKKKEEIKRDCILWEENLFDS